MTGGGGGGTIRFLPGAIGQLKLLCTRHLVFNDLERTRNLI